MNTTELVRSTASLVSRLLRAQSVDVRGLREEGQNLLRQLERDMSVFAVEQPQAAYSGTRAWYLLDEMFRHATLLGTDQAPTSSDSLPKSAL